MACKIQLDLGRNLRYLSTEMSVLKRTNRTGQMVWYYQFDGPGSTREKRGRVSQSGFPTKRKAEDAEALRRIEEQQKQELSKTGVNIAVPKTLSMLLEEFFCQHVDENLAPKTVERYHEQAAYLDPELLKIPIREITPLQLGREWKRLLKTGGHHRRTKAPRPLSAKTVRNIAGIVSSAFARAIKWGLVMANPVSASEPPVPKKRRGIALTPEQQRTLFAAATEPWCLSTFLEVLAGTGARRGEILALRWSEFDEGRVRITRSRNWSSRVRRRRTANAVLAFHPRP